MLDKFRGALMGVRIGDALGAPFETWTHEQIARHTKGLGPETFYDPLLRGKGYHCGLNRGDFTDDWQLTRVVAETFIAARCWDAGESIRKHLSAYEQSTIGWGKGTRIAIEAIRRGERTGYIAPPLLEHTGAGNGIVMKIAPVGLFYAAKEKSSRPAAIFSAVQSLALMTHAHPHALIAAFMLARCIETLSAQHRLSDLDLLFSEIRTLEEELCSSAQCTFSDQLETLPYIARDGINALRGAVNPGFLATETALTALGVFLIFGDEPERAMRETILLGGDTDTNASVVGALLGSAHGPSAFPERWREFRPDFHDAIAVADALYAAAHSSA